MHSQTPAPSAGRGTSPGLWRAGWGLWSSPGGLCCQLHCPLHPQLPQAPLECQPLQGRSRPGTEPCGVHIPPPADPAPLESPPFALPPNCPATFPLLKCAEFPGPWAFAPATPAPALLLWRPQSAAGSFQEEVPCVWPLSALHTAGSQSVVHGERCWVTGACSRSWGSLLWTLPTQSSEKHLRSSCT